MRLLYFFSLLFLLSCTSTPEKPKAKKPHPDLKRDTLQGSIRTQTQVNYIFIEDTLTKKTLQQKAYELSITYDPQGYLIENSYQDDSLQEQTRFYYDEEHRVIVENYMHKTLKNNEIKMTLTHYQYDTLGYEVSRLRYDYSDSLPEVTRFDTEYDKDGNIQSVVKSVFEQNDWQLSDREVYKYNTKGYEQEKESYYYYRALWMLQEKKISRYEKDSLLVEKLFYNYKLHNLPSRVLYRYKGLLQEVTYINPKDSITSMVSFEYNPQGEITKYVEYTPEGFEKKRIFHLYTPFRERLEDVTYKNNTEDERTLYRYDVKGNLTEKITYRDQKITSKTEVKYTYYEAIPPVK